MFYEFHPRSYKKRPRQLKRVLARILPRRPTNILTKILTKILNKFFSWFLPRRLVKIIATNLTKIVPQVFIKRLMNASCQDYFLPRFLKDSSKTTKPLSPGWLWLRQVFLFRSTWSKHASVCISNKWTGNCPDCEWLGAVIKLLFTNTRHHTQVCSSFLAASFVFRILLCPLCDFVV